MDGYDKILRAQMLQEYEDEIALKIEVDNESRKGSETLAGRGRRSRGERMTARDCLDESRELARKGREIIKQISEGYDELREVVNGIRSLQDDAYDRDAEAAVNKIEDMIQRLANENGDIEKAVSAW